MKYQIRKSCFETNSSSMHSLVMTRKNVNVRMTQEEIRGEFYLDAPWYVERHKNDEHEVVKVNEYEGCEYGRSPFEVLCTFRDKLSYAIAEYCGNNYDINSYVKSEVYFNEVFVPLLTRLIGCDEIDIDCEYHDFLIYSDIDTEYLDEAEEVLIGNLVYADKKDRNESDELILGMYKNVDINGRSIEEACFKVPKFGGIDHQSCGVLRNFLAKNNLTLEDYLVRKDIVVIIDGDEYCVFGNMIDCGLIDKDNVVGYGKDDEDAVSDEE